MIYFYLTTQSYGKRQHHLLSPEHQYQIGWQSLFLQDHHHWRYQVYQTKWNYFSDHVVLDHQLIIDDCRMSTLLSKQSHFALNRVFSFWILFITIYFRLLKPSLMPLMLLMILSSRLFNESAVTAISFLPRVLHSWVLLTDSCSSYESFIIKIINTLCLAASQHQYINSQRRSHNE